MERFVRNLDRVECGIGLETTASFTFYSTSLMTNPRLRTITATLLHTESGTQEEQTVTIEFNDYTDQYSLVKVFVLELGKKVVLDKDTNEILLPD